MTRYRYRTPVLTGPWRDTRDAAIRDAIAARQARAEGPLPESLEWTVPGEIEERDDPDTLRKMSRH